MQTFAADAATASVRAGLADFRVGSLPEISHLFRDGRVQDLEQSNTIFTDESVGFLLSTPSAEGSITIPEFIEEGIKTGKYTEIFNFEGYRFIKIR